MIWVLLVAVTLMLSLVMMFAWLLQRLLGNAGWVDGIWSLGLGLAGVVYAVAPVSDVVWPGPRQLLVAALIAVWSLRLGLHIMDRTRNGSEDLRYAQLRQDWGAAFQRRMFWFLQIQAAVAAVLALSMFLAAHNPRPVGSNDGLGLVIFAIAILDEAIADTQLRRFRADPAHRGQICDTGLWRLSRHPNYFFEWLGWLAYPLFALDLSGGYPVGWLAVSGPALMYWLLVHLSGIPPLERQMLRTRGIAYRRYQARTRPFLPFLLLRQP